MNCQSSGHDLFRPTRDERGIHDPCQLHIIKNNNGSMMVKRSVGKWMEKGKGGCGRRVRPKPLDLERSRGRTGGRGGLTRPGGLESHKLQDWTTTYYYT